MLSQHTKQPKRVIHEPPSAARAANVIELQMRVCDASAIQSRRGQIQGVEPGTDYVLVWVRENPDPAYMVTPAGSNWTVTDCVRQQVLGQLRTFEEALEFIRPVLGVSRAA